MRAVRWTDAVRIPEEGEARVWRFAGRPTTAIQGEDHQKTLSGFHGDRELARECLEVWRSNDYGGVPSGPAAFFHQEVKPPHTNWTVNSRLADHFHGGWMETFQRGHVPGPAGYYDLRSAYAWAGSKPLPERFRPYRPGDRKYLMIMERTGGPSFLPRYFRRPRILVTHKDVEVYGLQGAPVWGISWREEDESTRVRDALEKDYGLPARAEKLLRQSFWGLWGCTTRAVQEQYVDGERVGGHELKCHAMCIPWATIIVHRVMRRVYRAALSGAILVCVDAVLRRSPLPSKLLGDEIGRFRLKEKIGPGGVRVEAPGRWSRAPVPEDPGRWDRHAGFTSPARAKRQLPERKLTYLMERMDLETVEEARRAVKDLRRYFGDLSWDREEIERSPLLMEYLRDRGRGEEPEEEELEELLSLLDLHI